jgi:hypothetical protein
MNRLTVLLVVTVALVFAFGVVFTPELYAQHADREAAQAMAAMMAVFFMMAIVAVAISLAILAVVAWLISGCLKAIPPEHREMEPAMVWLILIPLFNVVWNFFVLPKTSRSFQRYFAAKGRTEFGDCGEKIGLWCAICGAASLALQLVFRLNFVVGPVVGLATLALLIIYLVKVMGLKQFVTP